MLFRSRLLEHRRDETVHRGVRDPRSSLKGCIGCHASPVSGSVAVAKTDFCVTCHAYAAVKLDCFECHASKPAVAALRSGLTAPHGPVAAPAAAAVTSRSAMPLRQLAGATAAGPALPGSLR